MQDRIRTRSQAAALDTLDSGNPARGSNILSDSGANSAGVTNISARDNSVMNNVGDSARILSDVLRLSFAELAQSLRTQSTTYEDISARLGA